MFVHKKYCRCCNGLIQTKDNICGACGSKYFKNTYGVWGLCFIICFSFLILFKLFDVFQQSSLQEQIIQHDHVIEELIVIQNK